MSFIVKITTVLNPLDLLAPHSCRGCGKLGSPICDRCKNNILTSKKSHKKNLYYVGYRKGLLTNLIHDYKYNSTHAISKELADLLNQSLPPFDGKIVIVPLPTISRHIRERGLDHTLLVAKKFAKLRGKNYQVKQLLERAKNTVQVGTDRKTRITQAASAYAIKPNAKIDPSLTYLLLDDVWTTGASMKAAKKKLQEAGASNIRMCVVALSLEEQ